MLIATRRARKFSAGLTWEEFSKSELHQLAIMKALETIGEAAGKISNEVKTANPMIPWVDIVGMRNRLIHDYFRLDLRKIWDTAKQDVPKLIALLEPLVPPEKS